MLHKIDIAMAGSAMRTSSWAVPLFGRRKMEKCNMRNLPLTPAVPCSNALPRSFQARPGRQCQCLNRQDCQTVGRSFRKPVAFDEETLKTIGIASYGDALKGQLTTAHPHCDEGSRFNYLLDFGRQSKYNIYTLPDGSSERRLVGSYTTDRPPYMHSFGLSQKYVVLMEFPLVVNPISILLRGKPFIANYSWEPQRGTRFPHMPAS